MLKKINWWYALGEIIIVIIGISIAFTLNRWAEKNQQQADKKQYLESLLVDVENEKEHLDSNIIKFQEKINTIRGLFPYLYGRKDGRGEIANKVFNLAQIIPFRPNDITYKTLINSGDLGLFDDFELKRALEDHYSSQVFVEQDYSRQTNINERYFGDFMIYNMDYNKIRNGDFSFMDDPLLTNIIQSLYGTYNIAIESSKAGIERCKNLTEKLEQAL